jgi:hypothetical protein
MLLFIKYFRKNILRKNDTSCKKIDQVLRKTSIFAENWQKLQQILIITSTPGNEVHAPCQQIF